MGEDCLYLPNHSILIVWLVLLLVARYVLLQNNDVLLDRFAVFYA